jgi:phenylalanyl-tRNA synthetase beta chain
VVREIKGGYKNLKLNWPSVMEYKAELKENPVNIEVLNTDACPRYVGLYIEGIEVKPSPQWLQNRLKAIGLRPINSVVDVTNFVLHEMGQPLHAFDADRIKGKKVVVRTAKQAEQFTTLDEVERKLHTDDLMICDEADGMCIAGVFGGISSGVTEATTNVFLESAYFNPVSIRKSAKRYGLNTDASFRFERGIDPETVVLAAKRAALLIQALAGGKLSTITDIYPDPIRHAKVEVKFASINRLIGQDIPKETVLSILDDLEVYVEKQTEEGLKLSIPSFKTDVTREADVIEEILRVYGYDNIKGSGQLKVPLIPLGKKDAEKTRNLVSDMFSSLGFNEIMSNSLTKGGYMETHFSDAAEKSVQILNPLSTDLNVMRQTLLFSGLEAVSRNIRHQHSDCKFYEFGNIYSKSKEEWPYEEHSSLGIFLTGKWRPDRWNVSSENVTFHHLHSAAKQLLNRLGIKAILKDLKRGSPFAYGMEFQSKNEERLVRFGSVRGDILAAFDIEQEVFYADVNWDTVFDTSSINEVEIAELAKYPSVRRDLALLVDKTVKYGRLEELAYQTERKLLKDVDLFDVYEGKGVPKGKRSYALSFILQDEKSTLKDKTIDKTMNRLQQRFEKEVGAELRG